MYIERDKVTRKPTRKYKRKPFSEEHRKKISMSKKGKPSANKGKKASLETTYKNMKAHLHYDVSLEFLMRFDIEKLKVLNDVIHRDRVSKHFTTEKYINYIKRFYNDDIFIKTYENYVRENRKQYAKPSLEHIVPLSKGGGWDLNNLMIIPWCINRAKYNFMPEEWNHIREKYFKDGW